ncbi:hypothetical protein CAOG_04395 [Capsaspora owczarzaki ATCC 30864]|uniref:Uncharacterized protein n=1 Tax=Capsaspora owczarzaki (strain ATCC 30864) TaxID=595528 RepID=A0A0D2WQ20_CAPO3|nr:hypothetical protein CAOG_04395 [Capsaspora owczarzaki ATCC 30864]KJE93640.1 hypothetical protein CAOG_004395 [Capsaspora owczarzaki ATCC 30864]|eukprot:XP_004348223.2 hypothetical protein CAOG_04395 [Capsaspora owczarzaki ATCC 30864]
MSGSKRESMAERVRTSFGSLDSELPESRRSSGSAFSTDSAAGSHRDSRGSRGSRGSRESRGEISVVALEDASRLLTHSATHAAAVAESGTGTSGSGHGNGSVSVSVSGSGSGSASKRSSAASELDPYANIDHVDNLDGRNSIPDVAGSYYTSRDFRRATASSDAAAAAAAAATGAHAGRTKRRSLIERMRQRLSWRRSSGGILTHQDQDDLDREERIQRQLIEDAEENTPLVAGTLATVLLIPDWVVAARVAAALMLVTGLVLTCIASAQLHLLQMPQRIIEGCRFEGHGGFLTVCASGHCAGQPFNECFTWHSLLHYSQLINIFAVGFATSMVYILVSAGTVARLLWVPRRLDVWPLALLCTAAVNILFSFGFILVLQQNPTLLWDIFFEGMPVLDLPLDLDSGGVYLIVAFCLTMSAVALELLVFRFRWRVHKRHTIYSPIL